MGEQGVECREGGRKDEGKACGCGLKHCVGHAFAGGREYEEGCVVAVAGRMVHLAGEKNGLGESKLLDPGAQASFFRTGAEERQLEVRPAGAQRGYSIQEGEKAFFRGEASDGEEPGTGAGGPRVLRSGRNGREVDGVGQDVEVFAGMTEVVNEVVDHGF